MADFDKTHTCRECKNVTHCSNSSLIDGMMDDIQDHDRVTAKRLSDIKHMEMVLEDAIESGRVDVTRSALVTRIIDSLRSWCRTNYTEIAYPQSFSATAPEASEMPILVQRLLGALKWRQKDFHSLIEQFDAAEAMKVLDQVRNA